MGWWWVLPAAVFVVMWLVIDIAAYREGVRVRRMILEDIERRRGRGPS